MKKLTLAMAGVALAAAVLGGCIDDNGHHNGGYYYYPTCQKFRTCDGCTKALGCGWCTSGNDGLCVREPNECASVSSFSFTWEPSGCPGGAATDGGIDYGPPVGPTSTDGGAHESGA
ncbi:MAG TPA: hypothetical protein VMU50_04140, partial [Polyangia bacterium]|nr:hypothetical protein [Polyangia bacterium]